MNRGTAGAPTAHRFATAAVATPHYLASHAGAAVLHQGGNAMDAAIAANLVLGVVAPYTCGIGGDCFAIVWDGDLHGYNGSGRAPAAATPAAVLDRLRPATGPAVGLAAPRAGLLPVTVPKADEAAGAPGQVAMPRSGPLPITVPGAVDAWFALLERFGSRSFAELVEPAAAYAENGFPLTAAGAARIAAGRPADPGWGDWPAIYGRSAPGTPLCQPDLARTLRAAAAGGPDAFYRGEIAAAVADHVQRLGGFLDAADLAAHRGEWVRPLEGRYRDLTVAELPPNSQGSAALLALHLLDGAGPLPPDGPERHHRLIEAVATALAERDAHLTDPAHMRLPPDVLADPGRATALAAHPAPPATARRGGGGDTAYLCAVDRSGLCVSLIQSNYNGFGSGVTVPGFGINLHNRGAYFSLDPDHVNVLAPAKRTLHTLMPALARRGGRPWLVFGTMGADGQLQTQVQLLARLVDDGADPAAALAAPRWLVDPGDHSVRIESRFSPAVLDGLRRHGHRLDVLGGWEDPMGHAHVIRIDGDGLTAASDPRCEGLAAGF
ncbi:MAG TPA: gamma-glutamyltransferase [Acidimicrobiia bacterium]